MRKYRNIKTMKYYEYRKNMKKPFFLFFSTSYRQNSHSEINITYLHIFSHIHTLLSNPSVPCSQSIIYYT